MRRHTGSRGDGYVVPCKKPATPRHPVRCRAVSGTGGVSKGGILLPVSVSADR